MRIVLTLFALLLAASPLRAEGLSITVSNADAVTTVTRLKAAIEKRNMTIVATIDHSAAAKGVGLELRPTVVLVFGNPRGGTPVMQCNQALGIELPMRILVWQAADSKVNVGFASPREMLARHNASACTPEVIGSMEKLLASLAAEAAGKQ
ncbi:MAG: DUF302 domain-containing protein [Hyphomicrobiaceae bacterium]|nr:MAG: DUF302 domain-containing protein [Hyphomicrobiaceae bacterium]